MKREEMKVRDVAHPMLPRLAPEDRSRQRAVVALRKLLTAKVRSGHHRRFVEDGVPAFVAEHGRSPEAMEEVEEALFNAAGYRMWSAADRGLQATLGLSVGEPIFRDAERMEASASTFINATAKKGSLHLNPTYEPSPEVAALDIHLQPGGYALNRHDKDIVAGALYEMGGNVFSFSVGGRKDDSKAAAVVRLIEDRFPEFRPGRILDLGCSAGAASAAYAWQYPEANVDAVDIGAGMLRYAHARAEALGVGVAFWQMDASALDFANSSFDLIVGHNLLHEIGDKKRRQMIGECHRVLKPGGLLVLQDVNTRFITDPIVQADIAWEKHFNGEGFWESYGNANLAAELNEAGFHREDISEHEIAAVAGALRWYVIMAEKGN